MRLPSTSSWMLSPARMPSQYADTCSIAQQTGVDMHDAGQQPHRTRGSIAFSFILPLSGLHCHARQTDPCSSQGIAFVLSDPVRAGQLAILVQRNTFAAWAVNGAKVLASALGCLLSTLLQKMLRSPQSAKPFLSPPRELCQRFNKQQDGVDFLLQKLTQHQQQVGQDGPNQGGGHYSVQPLGEGHNGQDELHHISKGGVEQAAHRGPESHGQVFCDLPQNQRQRDQPDDVLQ